MASLIERWPNVTSRFFPTSKMTLNQPCGEQSSIKQTFQRVPKELTWASLLLCILCCNNKSTGISGNCKSWSPCKIHFNQSYTIKTWRADFLYCVLQNLLTWTSSDYNLQKTLAVKIQTSAKPTWPDQANYLAFERSGVI